MAAHTQIFRSVCRSSFIRPLVKIYDILFSKVIRLESVEVGENCPTVGHNLQISVAQNAGDGPSDLRYKIRTIHHIPTSWQRFRGTAFFRVQDQSAKKTNK